MKQQELPLSLDRTHDQVTARSRYETQILNREGALFAPAKVIDNNLQRLAAQILVNITGSLVRREVLARKFTLSERFIVQRKEDAIAI